MAQFIKKPVQENYFKTILPALVMTPASFGIQTVVIPTMIG